MDAGTLRIKRERVAMNAIMEKILEDENATRALAGRVAALARSGDVFALAGDLGAGKTVFARAFIEALEGHDEEVPSPTFTLVQTYELPENLIYHFDLYRLENPEEAYELDIEEAFAEGISLIEWPDRLGTLLPEGALTVNLEHGGGNARRVTLSGGGAWKARLKGAALSGRRALIDGFLKAAGWAGAEHRLLAGDASFRRYERVSLDGRRAMLMDAPPEHEDVRPFLAIARHLKGLGFSAPDVLAEDTANGFLLLEDLGEDTYTRMLANGGDEEALYVLATDVLIALHRLPEDQAIPGGLLPYDDVRLLEEACLLTDWYMPAILGQETSAEVRDSYIRAWCDLFPQVHAGKQTLVLRDYHVDNLMWLPERDGPARCGLLDFQDAVAGSPAYDLMSLLEDARRDIDDSRIERMKARYAAAFPDFDNHAFAARFAILGAQRHAKVIGIFTRLCVRDGKPVYLEHIPRVWRLLERSCKHPVLKGMRDWLDTHIPKKKRGLPSCRAKAK